jgi:hypothetical protein
MLYPAHTAPPLIGFVSGCFTTASCPRTMLVGGKDSSRPWFQRSYAGEQLPTSLVYYT